MGRPIAMGAWAAAACALGGLALAAHLAPAARGTRKSPRLTHIDASRHFNHGSALLGASVLLDSVMEHSRGAFANPAMYLAPAAAVLSTVAGFHGGRDRTPATHRLRHGVYWTTAGVGLAGTGFHLYNILKRPGQWSWQNLFYAAPLGAPMALLLSGALGATAERLRNQPAHAPRLMGLSAGRALSLVSGLGLLGTSVEAALLHFRGSFQHPAMYLPVSLPPLAGGTLLYTAVAPPRARWIIRLGLRITVALGWLGAAFHARGIARHQGGWRNWSQNLFNGPPLPAPPSFSALAYAGLAALRLRERERS